MDQKIEPITEAEREWITSQFEGARLLVESCSPQDRDQPLTLGAMDRAFAGWLAAGVADPDQINAAINGTGVVFGQALVDELGLEWVIATDQYGSDLAVYGLPGAGDVLVYPANFVAKRWERRETHFLERSFQQMREQIRAVRQPDPSSRQAKPWWKFW